MSKVFNIKEQWQFDEFITAISDSQRKERESFFAYIQYNEKDSYILDKTFSVNNATVTIKGLGNFYPTIEVRSDGKLEFVNSEFYLRGIYMESNDDVVRNRPIIELTDNCKFKCSDSKFDFSDVYGIQLFVMTSGTFMELTDVQVMFNNNDGVSRAIVVQDVLETYINKCSFTNGENAVWTSSTVNREREEDKLSIYDTVLTSQRIPIYSQSPVGAKFSITVDHCTFDELNINNNPVFRVKSQAIINMNRCRVNGIGNNRCLIDTDDSNIKLTMKSSEIDCHITSNKVTGNIIITNSTIMELSSEEIPLLYMSDGVCYIERSTLVSNFKVFDINATAINGSVVITDSDITNLVDGSPVTNKIVSNILTLLSGNTINLNNATIEIESDHGLVSNNLVKSSDNDPIKITGEGFSWEANMLNWSEYLHVE